MNKTLRSSFLAALLVIAPLGGLVGIQHTLGNVHKVDNSLYRSGQLTPSQLDHLIRTTGIRSILNLRGDHPSETWWRDETLVAASNGVIHGSIPISARQMPDLATMREIVTFMKEAPKPLLVHCMAGADRSGLAAALYEFAVAGTDRETASEQLSIRYGHFPWLGSRTKAMDEAFDAFIASQGRNNSAPAGTTS